MEKNNGRHILFEPAEPHRRLALEPHLLLLPPRSQELLSPGPRALRSLRPPRSEPASRIRTDRLSGLRQPPIRVREVPAYPTPGPMRRPITAPVATDGTVWKFRVSYVTLVFVTRVAWYTSQLPRRRGVLPVRGRYGPAEETSSLRACPLRRGWDKFLAPARARAGHAIVVVVERQTMSRPLPAMGRRRLNLFIGYVPSLLLPAL